MAPPFNTSAVDLRLGPEILIPKAGPAAFDLRQSGIKDFLTANSEKITITKDQPYSLKRGDFVLGKTMELVDFPLPTTPKARRGAMKGQKANGVFYSARVEGRSSLARCGILIHFTAPTIHADFSGTITLEITNLGPLNFLLYPGMFVCQLIIEEVKGLPYPGNNQFKGQTTPAGH
jgi:dCTP deaminase